MHFRPESGDSEGAGGPVHGESEATYMHDAVMALMFMVIVMFPCFLSSATPE
jgi:hypothetical protein